MVATVSFVCYVTVFGEELDPKTIFTALAYFGILRKPLQMYPRVLSASLDGFVAAQRVQKFLLRPDLKRLKSQPLDDDGASSRATCLPSVKIANGTFSWTNPPCPELSKARSDAKVKENESSKGSDVEMTTVVDEADDVSKCSTPTAAVLPIIEPLAMKNRASTRRTLLTIDCLNVSGNKLVCVVGPVGAYKSSLLCSILGEMPATTSGPSPVTVRGRVAYVPQSCFIMNADLRSNILFGSAFDKSRYDRVIYQCALKPDLDMLPQGDRTEIGERGINVSGGTCLSSSDVVFSSSPLP